MKKYPNPNKGPSEVVLRPVLGLEDFNFGGEVPTEEKADWEKMSGRTVHGMSIPGVHIRHSGTGPAGAPPAPRPLPQEAICE